MPYYEILITGTSCEHIDRTNLCDQSYKCVFFVCRVYALDDDADDNAKVSYEITNDDECPSCFKFDMTADDEDKNRAWLKVDNSDALQVC